MSKRPCRWWGLFVFGGGGWVDARGWGQPLLIAASSGQAGAGHVEDEFTNKRKYEEDQGSYEEGHASLIAFIGEAVTHGPYVSV
jgi:hypothetical protein